MEGNAFRRDADSNIRETLLRIMRKVDRPREKPMPLSIQTVTLAAGDVSQRDQALAVLLASFADRERYGEARLRAELAPQPTPLYRAFFLAQQENQVVGVSGIKAAEWASDTHVLYLSAVAPPARGQGIGRHLLAARIGWLRTQFAHGRLLVSTAKTKRFKDFGFKPVGKYEKDGRQLMLLEF